MVRFSPCPDYSPDRCRTALEAVVGDLRWVRPGTRIGIKANLLHAASPDTAATTHPALLKALTDLLRERGADVVIGDSPGGLYTAAHLDKVYRVCGLEACGAALNHDFSVKDGEFPDGKVLKRFQYTGWLDGCDAVINFCKLKTHGMMAMTCAVKNFFGTIPGTIKPEYHFRFPDPADFANMLVDLQLYWKPRLHIVDAVTAMEGNGPSSGTPTNMNVLLFSADPVALDSVFAALVHLDPATVPTCVSGEAFGLGVMNQDHISVVTPEGKITVSEAAARYGKPDFDVFRGQMKKGLLFKVMPLLPFLQHRPKADMRKCIACGICEEACPVPEKAVKSGHGQKAKYDYSKCIRCYCCQEMCPAKAIEVYRHPLAKMLSGK